MSCHFTLCIQALLMDSSLSALLPPSKHTIRTRWRWFWQNLGRLFLIKVWFQCALVLAVIAWWLQGRNPASTLCAALLIMVVSSWMMNRERIRRHLSGDSTGKGRAGRAEDDWLPLDRPLLTLQEIEARCRVQAKKDRTAFRVGLACTVLAAVMGIAGFLI